MSMFLSWPRVALLFGITAIAEIGGCFAVYAWLRKGASPWWLLPGAVSLALFAWLLALHPSGAACRTYAAYGGVYVAASMLWLWFIERQIPDQWDVIGAAVCLVGTVLIVFGPRG
jgi:small multidrug resistance family-3 protein